jgi:putative hemolysin
MIPLPQLAMCKIPKGDGNKNEEFDYNNIISYFSIIIIIETWAPLPPNCSAWGSRSREG